MSKISKTHKIQILKTFRGDLSIEEWQNISIELTKTFKACLESYGKHVELESCIQSNVEIQFKHALGTKKELISRLKLLNKT